MNNQLGVSGAANCTILPININGLISEMCNAVYWGPKDVLEAYFKDQKSLNTPILRIKLSAYVAQTGPDQFTSDDVDVKQTGKGLQGEEEYKKLRWGNYPVRTEELIVENHKFLMAWVGLNDPQG